MLGKLALFSVCVAVAFSVCTDKVTNVVQISDDSNGNYNVVFNNADGATYDNNSNPSCYNNEANLRMPGVLGLISGTVVVNQAIVLDNATQALLTLTKNDNLIKTACKDGKSNNFLIPDKDCTPGTHTLGELEGDAGIGSEIALPNLSDAIKPLLKGQWRVTIKIQNGAGTVVASILIPSNEDWLWIEQ
uniref:Uncharacterized protein n=1 Tax=Acrobeloides nanus TaxID=290746 RepID=A0A914E371_9BILA